MSEKAGTWCADVAAASIELLAGTVTLLLLPAGQNVHVHWPGWKVLDHDPLVGAVVLVGAVDAARVPVGPVDELAKHAHGEGVNGRADDDLPTGAGERGTLDLLSGGRVKQTIVVVRWCWTFLFLFFHRKSATCWILQAGVGPVQSFFFVIQSESVWPHETAVHNLSPEVSAQGSTFNFCMGAPVCPVHVSVDEGDIH